MSRSAKVKHLMDMDERFCPSVWDAFARMVFLRGFRQGVGGVGVAGGQAHL